MSILLEALRKSEKGQRPAEAPTIHAQQHMAVDAEPLRPGPLALLLIVSLLLIGWVVWRQYELPAGGYQPPITLPASQESTTGARTSETQSADSGEATEPTNKPPSKPKATPVEGTTQRTPVENTEQHTPVEGSARRTPVEGYQQPANVAEVVDQPVLTSTPEDLRPGETSERPKPAAVTQAADNTSTSGRSAGRYPAPISYWELPDSIRADVPEITFSVLVYDSQPANRFVLAGGQRLGEGDSFQEGLVVEEIRRDGVVFSYRRYKFLVDR